MEDTKQWERYIKYLMLWAIDHEDNAFEFNSPACYDEFCDNDDEPDYYNELDIKRLKRDFNKVVKKWEKQ